MRYGLSYCGLDRSDIPFDLTDKHGALNRGDAEMRKLVFVGVRGKTAGRLLADEERGQLILHNFREKADILADQFIILANFIADGPDRTATGHVESLLELDVPVEPAFQIVPGVDFVADGIGARLERIQIIPEHCVHQSFLTFEVVVELALAR